MNQKTAACASHLQSALDLAKASSDRFLAYLIGMAVEHCENDNERETVGELVGDPAWRSGGHGQ